MQTKNKNFEHHSIAKEKISLIEHLQGILPQFSKGELKRLLDNGQVWVSGARTRRATKPLTIGSRISIYYRPTTPLELERLKLIRCLVSAPHFGLYYKPAGLQTQGTLYGDHLSLIRHLEKLKGEAHLIHRLDHEVQGILLVAHQKQSARELSQLMQAGEIKKEYLAVVKGLVIKDSGTIDYNLEGKVAKTSYQVLARRLEDQQTLLKVKIETGRKHQIRRHLDMIGHPVMGDPRHGIGNKNREGLQLAATLLEFTYLKEHYRAELSAEDLTNFVLNPGENHVPIPRQSH